MNPLLSVIVPVYNVEKTIQERIDRINALPVEKEIIVVNDCSKDNTESILRSLSLSNLKVIHHVSSRGKLSALRSGLENAQGEFVLIQNGDSGCSLPDYLKLLDAIKESGADIILGGRELQKGKKYLLAAFLNIFFRANLRDWFTHCQLLRRESFLLLAPELKSADFSFELLTKALRKKMRVMEVAIA